MAKDKSIINIASPIVLAGGVGASGCSLLPQGANPAAGIAQAQTVSGLRWEISFAASSAVAVGGQALKWAIYVRRKLQTIPGWGGNIAGGVGDAFPNIDENNVLVWGCGVITNAVNRYTTSGATKTQRKMQVGDQLWFAVGIAGTGAETLVYNGIIQTFFKS